MTATDELLPCPFCGEPANLCKQRFVSYDGSIHRCYWHVIHRCRHGNYTETKLCGTKAEARAAWNRREAIAATLGAGTCRPREVRSRFSKTQERVTYYCECGYELGGYMTAELPFPHTYNEDSLPNFCPNCGRKVVDG